ncbi:hypothetical protein GGR56DRAFT_646088, partial [Xylariaceae sp. FL0804]
MGVMGTMGASSVDRAEVLSKAETAELMGKIDFRGLSKLSPVHVVAFLDKPDISNALTTSMPKHLGLTGQEPDTALTAAFFVPYIIFEIRSSLLTKRFTPRVWLSACMLGLGVVELCQGFVPVPVVPSYSSGLLATRFFLGLCRAGVFPGSFCLISFSYHAQGGSRRRFTVYPLLRSPRSCLWRSPRVRHRKDGTAVGGA